MIEVDATAMLSTDKWHFENLLDPSDRIFGSSLQRHAV